MSNGKAGPATGDAPPGEDDLCDPQNRGSSAALATARRQCCGIRGNVFKGHGDGHFTRKCPGGCVDRTAVVGKGLAGGGTGQEAPVLSMVGVMRQWQGAKAHR